MIHRFSYFLTLFLFVTQSYAQQGPLHSTPITAQEGRAEASTAYLDKESLGQYGNLLPDFLRDQIETGKLPLYAKLKSVVLSDSDIQKSLESIAGSHEYSAQNPPSAADFHGFMQTPGAPFNVKSDIGSEGAQFLWNYTSNFWAYKNLEFRFSIEDGILPSLKAENLSTRAIFRTNGTMERVNPMLGDDPKLSAQAFRERVTFKAQKGEPYTFLTIRFVTDFPDGVWVRSPVAKMTRRLYGANRDDSILGSAFTLNDLLGYSAHFARSTALVGPQAELLTPFVEGSTIETSVDDECGRFKSKYRNVTRSLPHLKGPAATLFSDIIFIPKILQRVDVLYRDPASVLGREELWFDVERGVPVYRIGYDHHGTRRHWAINAFETGLIGSDLLVFPRLTFLGDEKHARLTLVRYTGGSFCRKMPTDPEVLKGFDPSGT